MAVSKTSNVTPSTPTTTTTSTSQVPHDKIAMRAYDKWCKRGRPTGSSEKQDWLEAEAELRMEMNRTSSTPQSTTRR